MTAPARCSRNVMAYIHDTTSANRSAIAACGIPENRHVKPERFGIIPPAIAAPIAPKQLGRCAIALSDLTRRSEDLVRAGAAGRRLAIAAAAARPRCAIALLEQPRPDAIPGLARLLFFSLLLSPTRWHAKNMASQLPGVTWARGAVDGATAPQPRHNHQTHGIARFSDRLCRFRGPSSRVMRMRMRVSVRTCRGGGNTTTTTTTSQIKLFQWVVGCEAVVVWLLAATYLTAPRDNGGFLRFSIILAAGYCPALAIRRRQMAGRAVLGSRAGETFGVSAGGARAIGAGSVVQALDLVRIGLELGPIRAVGENGGFLRVSPGCCGLVGSAMLERWPQRRGNPCVVGIGRKPVGLARGLELVALGARPADQAAPADRPAGPPYAPIRARPRLVHAGALACRNLDRLCPSIIPGALRGRAGRCQTLRITIGSGFGNAPGQFAAAMGRGSGAKRMSGKLIGLRRVADVTGSAVHVN